MPHCNQKFTEKETDKNFEKQTLLKTSNKKMIRDIIDIAVATTIIVGAIFMVTYGIFGVIVLWSTVKDLIKRDYDSY